MGFHPMKGLGFPSQVLQAAQCQWGGTENLSLLSVGTSVGPELTLGVPKAMQPPSTTPPLVQCCELDLEIWVGITAVIA